MENTMKMYITADEVAELLGVSRGYAYKVIRGLNDASLLVEMGFQPLAIAERLGHEKIETTLNTYSHLYPNKQAELAEKLEIANGEE